MKTIVFTMALVYRDKGIGEKQTFASKESALEWFQKFKSQNKRPVTITFYCDKSPYWVFTQN